VDLLIAGYPVSLLLPCGKKTELLPRALSFLQTFDNGFAY